MRHALFARRDQRSAILISGMCDLEPAIGLEAVAEMNNLNGRVSADEHSQKNTQRFVGIVSTVSCPHGGDVGVVVSVTITRGLSLVASACH